ncbi:hypothetical protein Dimus_007966 [Dionaea muscipula]
MRTVDADLQVRTRRRLRKATSVEVVAVVNSEETQSDEDVLRLASDSGMNMEVQTKKRHQKQVARIRPPTKKAKIDKGEASVMEVETEPSKEPVVAGSPTIDELD